MPLDSLQLIGATIGDKYRLESVAGEGGFGVVYKATHLLWKRAVAVKVFKALGDVAPGDRSKVLDEFVREGALLAELSERCAAVVQARDLGMLTTPKGQQLPYMVLEWLEGATLEAVILQEKRRGIAARSLEEAMRLLDPVAQALALAHGKGIAHRDLKPANIFVLGDARSSAATVKVLDFGLAKVVRDAQKMTGSSSKTNGQLTSFTPAYGAPEQFTRSHGSTGPWTDVFALALVCVEALTQRPALEGDDFVQLGYASSDPTRRPTPAARGAVISDAAEAVFARALSVRPEDRYPTCGAFWTALRARPSLAPPRHAAAKAAAGAKPADESLATAPTARFEPAPTFTPTRAATTQPRPQPKEEALIPLTLGRGGAVEPATQIRSTLIAASLLTLRSLGYFDCYLANLPPALHDRILHSVAGAWIPMADGVAHYQAADAMGLSIEERQDIGKGVAARIQDSVLGTLVRVARTAGVTPWIGLEYVPKLWKRVIEGGGVALYKLGPKEARVECHGAPALATIDYFRDGFRGMFLGSGTLFAHKLYVTDLGKFAARGVIGFRVAWV